MTWSHLFLILRGKLRLTDDSGAFNNTGKSSSGALPRSAASFQLTCVYDLLDDIGHLALEQGVEHLDKEDETSAENHQGARQQNEPHSQVG